MSWEEETKSLSQEEQLELIAQARKDLTKTIKQLNTLERQHEAKMASDKQ